MVDTANECSTFVFRTNLWYTCGWMDTVRLVVMSGFYKIIRNLGNIAYRLKIEMFKKLVVFENG
jgi:hypothetical protein